MAEGDRHTLQLKFLTGWLAVVWKRFYYFTSTLSSQLCEGTFPLLPSPTPPSASWEVTRRQREQENWPAQERLWGWRNKEGMSSTEEGPGMDGGEDRESNKKFLYSTIRELDWGLCQWGNWLEAKSVGQSRQATKSLAPLESSKIIQKLLFKSPNTRHLGSYNG